MQRGYIDECQKCTNHGGFDGAFVSCKRKPDYTTMIRTSIYALGDFADAPKTVFVECFDENIELNK